MAPETEIDPLIPAPVTTVTLTLAERGMLNRPQKSGFIPAVRIMTTQTDKLFWIAVKMGFIEDRSGLMTGEAEAGAILSQKPRIGRRMGIMTTVALIAGKRAVRKSIDFFRFFMTGVTFAARFHFEQFLKVGNMSLMTGSALTVSYRLMQKITFLNLIHKFRVTIATEFARALIEQGRITGGMGAVAGRALTLYYRLMAKLFLKITLIMTIKAVVGES